MMHAATFDDLVNACLLDDAKHRMLYVFVRVAEMDAATRAAMGVTDDEAAVVQVLFDAQQPAEPGLKFEQVQTAADAHNTDWTLCVTGAANCADGTLPSEEQAQTLIRTAFSTTVREAGDQLDRARLGWARALHDYLTARSAFARATGVAPEETGEPLTAQR